MPKFLDLMRQVINDPAVEIVTTSARKIVVPRSSAFAHG